MLNIDMQMEGFQKEHLETHKALKECWWIW